MTKFILHGGETGIPNENNKAFYQEWVKDFDDDKTPTILLVYFSRPQNIWNDLEKSDKERFAKYTNNRKARFIVAEKDTGKLREQFAEANVVYFRGGDPQKIVDIFSPSKDEFLSMVEGKVYVGSSAGVMFLSDFSRSANRDWQKWLSLLPINSFVHYSEDAKNELEEFIKSHPENEKEYVLLPETEYVVKKFDSKLQYGIK